jgi:putative acetyltransferase
MPTPYQDFLIRAWQPTDRMAVAAVIGMVLAEYGLGWEPLGADRDVLEVEQFYQNGEFWVVEQAGQVVGTAAYCPTHRGVRAVELRKMYLLATVRGKGLGRHLLQQLEQAVAAQGFQQIWLETATILQSAIKLYENSGYTLMTGVETPRCDRVYCKSLTIAKS